ncbi:unnamed protein product [Nezara viridula]|uniref:Hairy n=1 Tax=Nezara viridula TaxID=85310 RepID=A0A9P0EEK2_NEZVI|nr:unnamed protein product [Nezara viridula]
MVTGSPAPQARPSDSNRRSNKPIMEKRRRARINHCLNELKSLILDAMKKDPARHSKLEKADILEMTVKHVESLQRSQVALSVAADPAVVNKFRAGWGECVGEVDRFPGLDSQVKKRLVEHLSSCMERSTEPSPVVTLVPTRLVNGDIALVVPCSPQQHKVPQQSAAVPQPAALPQPALPPQPEPLSLVVKEEKPCWRPW